MLVDLAAPVEGPAPLQDIQHPIQGTLSVLPSLLFGFGHVQVMENGIDDIDPLWPDCLDISVKRRHRSKA